MKKIISLILVLTFLLSITAFAHPFKDVSGHWAEAEIEKAFANKVVNGDGDGQFRPDDAITRGEFVKMVAVLVCEKLSAANGEEIVIPDEMGDGTHWASKYAAFAGAYMFAPLGGEPVDGVSVGEISQNYDGEINRYEMAYILGETAYNLTGEGRLAGELAFSDAKEMAQYPELLVAAINTTAQLGFMKGDENNNFAPAQSGTRAEAVTVINRMDAYLQGIIDAVEESEQAYKQELGENRVTYTEIPKGHPQATILMEDNKRIVIELYPEYAPQTVANFVKLAKDGFYNGTTFHRVIEGFMAQGGDPDGDGTGGSGKYIVGEFSANDFEQNTLKHERGIVSMARSNDPNSASSQFFICYDNAEFLDGQYAAFGKVKSGMEVVDAFTKVEMTMNNSGEMAMPKTPIKIKSITIR